MGEKNRQSILKPPVNGRLLREIARRIVKKIKPEKIILFGSYVNSVPDKNSDLDLLVIKNTNLPVSKRYAAVSDALYPRVIPMDFIVRTPDEIKSRLEGFDPFIRGIFNSGKVLYEKPLC